MPGRRQPREGRRIRLRQRAAGDVLAVLRYHRSGLYTLALLVGLAAGAGAICFRLGIDAWAHLLAGGAGDSTAPGQVGQGLLSGAGRWFLLLAPVVSGLVVGPVMTWLGATTTGHGVAGAIWSARRGDGAMAPLPATASVVAAALTIGGGGSVGPEGPIAELGASTASLADRRLGLPTRSVRMLAAAGTAAGIAAAFNAPLAGAFFAMEVILLDFTVDAFTFVVLACVSATVLSHQVLGEAVTMSLPELDLAGDARLGWVALLGLTGGVVGVAFSRCRYLMADAAAWLWRRTHLPSWARPAAGGLAVGALLMAWPQSYGESSAVLGTVLDGEHGVWALTGLMALKIVATSLTLAVGFAGGVFAPSLFIGACLGAAFGLALVPDHPSAAAVFGVIGMGAVFTGAARAPITAVVLIIEMTSQYSLLTPLMLASVLATFASRFLTRTTIYTEELRRRGEDVEDPLAATLVGRATARRLMSAPPAVLLASDRLGHAARVLHASGSSVLPVVDDAVAPGAGSLGSLLGCVSAVQIAEALAEPDHSRARTLGELRLTHEQVEEHEEATAVLALLSRSHADGVPVARRPHAAGAPAWELVGWIAQQDMVRRLYRHQHAAQEAAASRTSLGARVQHWLHQGHRPL
ncbi:chloride channel protein [Actinomyces faecalis]|uniref:chloride channel protein n=1 Tax=Actinomyces faecalis TaxID=2722820 RepID=UPI002E2C11D6|nr:chloride channel protein [Actinomyces faecalis]